MIALAKPECLLPANIFANECPCCGPSCCEPVMPDSLTVTISADECSCQDDVFAGTVEQVAESIVEIIKKGVAELEAKGGCG